MSRRRKWEETSFGLSLNLDGLIPDECESVLLCANSPGGYIPLQVLLPHQIYRHDLAEFKRLRTYKTFTVIPLGKERVKV